MTTDPAPTVIIVSGGSHIRFLSYVNHRIYALENGFQHRLEVSLGEGITSPYWHKFLAIRNVLGDADWALWIDDDAFFTEWNAHSIRELVADAARRDLFFVAAEGPVEPSGLWSKINTGVMLLRNDPRTVRLLDLAADAKLSSVRAWWDDARDGLFTEGDQDTIWWALQTTPEFAGGFDIVGHRALNSRPHYYERHLDEATVVHFPGPGDKDRKIAEFGRRFGLGQALVPQRLLTKYSVRRPDRMSAGEYRRRDVVERAEQLAKRVRRKIAWWRAGRPRS